MSRKSFKGPVTDTSTTESDLGQAGDLRVDENGNEYILVKAGVTLADGVAVSWAGATGYTVGLPQAVGDPVVGFNNTGAAISAANTYFWAKKRGHGYFATGGTAQTAADVLTAGTDGIADDHTVGSSEACATASAAATTDDTTVTAYLYGIG